MSYTEEEIKKYLDILHNYKLERGVDKKGVVASCLGCSNKKSFYIDFGYKICDECGTLNGHVLGFYDLKDYDRVHYRKKSVYYRKYYYDKKINQISKVINLNDDEKCELYNRLIEIDNHIMEILKKQYSRKRMININYLMKKILEEMGCEKYKLIVLNISNDTFNFYEKWWKNYINLNK